MSTSLPVPQQEMPPATLPVPCPTAPVAGRPVETTTPVFDWTPVPDATRYRVQIASTEAFGAVHYDETTDRGSAVPLGSVLPDDVETACWRVRAEGREEVRSDWSELARVAVPSAGLESATGTVRVEAPPVPLHPTSDQDPPLDQSAVPFTWEAVPEATGYQLQVAPADAPEAPVVDLTVDQTTSVTLYDTLSGEGTSFRWRVRPLFRVAQPGPWSDPVPFVVAPPVDDEERAPEAENPWASARIAGPATQAQTSTTLSVTVSLFAVLSFLATIALIVLAG
ncbi:DNA-binding protein [Salinibacter altiplanensis]|uniref:DNA-binding protein n=1 Tax=Salinibacter altiplanensis TaxID=1803181 RepID=UPI001F1B9BBE|nr:DNA-binding protein [Salinibacter altiplanensis]